LGRAVTADPYFVALPPTSPPAAVQPVPAWPAPAGHPYAWPAPGVHYNPPPLPEHVRLRDLLPGREWWQSSAWLQGSLGLFVACALTPFILLQATVNDHDVRPAAWGFTIYFALIWLIALKALLKPERVSGWRLVQVIATTGVLGVSVAITIERHLAANASTLAHSIFTVGIPEELAKALPLIIVLITAGSSLTPRTYLYLGAVSGLAFGAVESVAYTALYSNGIERTGDTGLVTGILWRLMTDSLFHAALAGIVGVFIGFAAAAGRRHLVLIAAGLAFAATLHGLYDRTAGHWSAILVATLVILIFAGYIHGSDDMLRGHRASGTG
jgi:RsiW-degrading membrane proteinase PrsW (M82 family)